MIQAISPERINSNEVSGDSALIELRGISKSYFDEVEITPISCLDMIISAGEFISIIGESGVGKSTLLNLLGGLITPDSGEILYCGKQLSSFNDKEKDELRRNHIGLIFQEAYVFQALTVRENLIFSTRSAHRKVALSEIDAMLGTLGLADRANHLPSELSVGQRRRLAVARCLLMKPRVILADEPTNDLDACWCKIIIDLLSEAAHEPGRAVVMVTHDSRFIQETTACYRLREEGVVSC